MAATQTKPRYSSSRRTRIFAYYLPAPAPAAARTCGTTYTHSAQNACTHTRTHITLLGPRCLCDDVQFAFPTLHNNTRARDAAVDARTRTTTVVKHCTHTRTHSHTCQPMYAKNIYDHTRRRSRRVGKAAKIGSGPYITCCIPEHIHTHTDARGAHSLRTLNWHTCQNCDSAQHTNQP